MRARLYEDRIWQGRRQCHDIIDCSWIPTRRYGKPRAYRSVSEELFIQDLLQNSQSKAERGESIVRVHWRLAHTATRSRPMLAIRSDRDHLRQSRATVLGTAGFRFQTVPNRCVSYGATKPPPLSGGLRQRQRQIRLQRDDERSQSSPPTMQTPKALNGVSSRILLSYTCVARRANPLSRAAPNNGATNRISIADGTHVAAGKHPKFPGGIQGNTRHRAGIFNN